MEVLAHFKFHRGKFRKGTKPLVTNLESYQNKLFEVNKII